MSRGMEGGMGRTPNRLGGARDLPLRSWNMLGMMMMTRRRRRRVRAGDESPGSQVHRYGELRRRIGKKLRDA